MRCGPSCSLLQLWKGEVHTYAGQVCVRCALHRLRVLAGQVCIRCALHRLGVLAGKQGRTEPHVQHASRPPHPHCLLLLGATGLLARPLREGQAFERGLRGLRERQAFERVRAAAAKRWGVSAPACEPPVPGHGKGGGRATAGEQRWGGRLPQVSRTACPAWCSLRPNHKVPSPTPHPKVRAPTPTPLRKQNPHPLRPAVAPAPGRLLSSPAQPAGWQSPKLLCTCCGACAKAATGGHRPRCAGPFPQGLGQGEPPAARGPPAPLAARLHRQNRHGPRGRGGRGGGAGHGGRCAGAGRQGAHERPPDACVAQAAGQQVPACCARQAARPVLQACGARRMCGPGSRAAGACMLRTPGRRTCAAGMWGGESRGQGGCGIGTVGIGCVKPRHRKNLASGA